MFAKGTITCTPEEFGFSWPLIKVINAEVLYCVIGKGDLAFNRLFKGVSGLFVLFWLYAVLLWTINLCYSPINAWPWICSHDFMQFSDPMWIIVNTTCWFITRLLKVACYENTSFVLLQYQPTICFLYYVVQKFWWKSLCCYMSVEGVFKDITHLPFFTGGFGLFHSCCLSISPPRTSLM